MLVMEVMYASLSSLELWKMDVQRGPINDLQEASAPKSNEEFGEHVESEPYKKKQRKNYDLIRKFKLEWAWNLPWAEARILTNNGRLHMVKCTMYSAMEKTKRLM